MAKLEIKGGPSTNDLEVCLDGRKLDNVVSLTLNPIRANQEITVSMTMFVNDLSIELEPSNIEKKYNIVADDGVYLDVDLERMINEALQNATP
jgi:uncharacterized membrane protein YvbJ